MAFQRVSVTPKTDASGNATVYSENVTGELRAIVWVKPGSGGITGATFAVTNETTGETLLSVSSVSASANYYPRGATASTANAASLYASGGTAVNDRLVLVNDRIKLVVSSGGNTLTGTMYFILS